MAQLQKLALCEIMVLEQIVQKQQQKFAENRSRIKEMATILKIPRLHHKYISSNGAADFVSRCEKVVKMHDVERHKQEVIDARVKLRQSVMWERVVKQKQGLSVSVVIPKTELPPLKEASEVDTESLSLSPSMACPKLNEPKRRDFLAIANSLNRQRNGRYGSTLESKDELYTETSRNEMWHWGQNSLVSQRTPRVRLL
jgi:hypothetical protein